MPIPAPDERVQEMIDDIIAVEDTFKQPSCLSKDPFIKYPSTGTPPVIDFNVPQKSAFTTYGHMVKYFPASYFKDFTKNVPENNYYNTVRNITAEQAIDLFHPNVGARPMPTVRARDIGIPSRDSVHPGAVPMPGFLSPEPSNTTSEGGSSSGASPTSSSPTIPGGPSGHAAGGAGGAWGGIYGAPPPGGGVAGGGAAGGAYGGAYGGADTIVTAIPMPIPYTPPPKPSLKADYAVKLLRPVDIARLNGAAYITNYVAEPPATVPRIIVIEEYTTVSYLGNYGAGRTVKTFSLLPGERTTISVRSYKDRISTVNASKNVLDSFSEASATELDILMQHEQGNMESTSSTTAGGASSFATSTDSKNSSKSFGISGKLPLGPISIGGGYGKSQGETHDSSHGFSSTHDYSSSGARMSNMNTLDSAMQKHVQQSNANRTMEINTSTSDTARSGEEDSTVRELKNVNLNNTLNFVFRQLLQEYVTITYLSNLKFAYTNGYMETYTVVDLNNLPNMLIDIIDQTNPNNMTNVLCKLLTPYCNVLNWQGTPKQFVSKLTITNTSCLDLAGCTPTPEVVYRINPACIDDYDVPPLDLSFNGVILSVKKHTLNTSSLYVDALLGRGDALDCFNQKAQNAENIGAYIGNLQSMQRLTDSLQNTANNQLFADQQLDKGLKDIDVITQQIAVINSIPTPADKADKYKKVFGTCCEVPQSCCGGGCGCNCNDEEPVGP